MRHILCLGLILLSASAAAAEMPPLAERGCREIARRVDSIPGDAPVFLASWEGGRGAGAAEDVALKGAAFTYDNALAVIALVACGRDAEADRIGRALLAAGSVRLRNAYRAGAQTEMPPPPNGWWSTAEGHWAEDPYQAGTATGNVAWAGLALLALAERDGASGTRWREGARGAALWASTEMADRHPPGGFAGGVFVSADGLHPLGWKSTEHNTDLAALFGRLGMAAEAGRARQFLDAMWQPREGRFLVGTLPDGVTANRRQSGLDAQLWPQLLSDASPAWRSAVDAAKRDYGVPGGFDFNTDRDGLWVEGTAQAALVYRQLGRSAEAERLLAVLAGQISPGGYLWATREGRITTGLAIGPDSVSADFFYDRRPHLGATAWACLADLGWNPFLRH